ncbi:LD-carboxypeptidase [Cryomorphaceae bacterium]|nr:LD-carboxypeptidase [Cryomorphaceae bacterium]
MSWRRPPYLHPGDTVGIVSTARKLSPAEIEPAVAVFEAWGFKVKLGPHLHQSYHQFSGTDQERAADLQLMIEDPGVKAIYCARGGYGSVRIIDHVLWEPLIERPKWILGYSDVTAIHNHLHSNLQIQSVHAPMPLEFSINSQECLEDVRSILTGDLQETHAPHHPFNQEGVSTGVLVGGNLSVLYSQRGTPSDLDVRGKILFIEDLDEYLYHMDRMMMNLVRGGWMDQISGLIVGGMQDMNDNTIPFGKQAIEIIREHTAGQSYPIAFGFPSGHLDDNRPLRFGAEIELSVETENTKIRYQS